MFELFGIISVVLVLFFSTIIVEKKLSNIEVQNENIMRVLKDITAKK